MDQNKVIFMKVAEFLWFHHIMLTMASDWIVSFQLSLTHLIKYHIIFTARFVK